MKTAALAIALTVGPTSSSEIDRLCASQAVRIWDMDTVADHMAQTPEAEAAQHFMAGCRAGIAKALPQPLETSPAPLSGRAWDGWGGLMDGGRD